MDLKEPELLPGWSTREVLVWGVVLFLIGLLPAIVNGFPLYQNDSPGYSGAYSFAGNIRSMMPAAVAKPFWPLLGPWSLPAINSAVFAVLVVRVKFILLPGVSMGTVVVAMVAAGVPVFTSSIMPDVWIGFAFLAFILVLERFSWVDFVVCVITLAGHGINVILFVASVILVAVLFRERRWHRVVLGIAIAACSLLAEATLSFATRGEIFPPRLGTAVIASKVINDVPASYDRFCELDPGEKICRLRKKIDARRRLNVDKMDQYLWDADLRSTDGPPEETLSWSEFNAVGVKLGWLALTEFPIAFFTKSVFDYPKMLSGNGCVSDGFGYGNALPDRWRGAGVLPTDDAESLARQGALEDNVVCTALSRTRLAMFVFAMAATLIVVFRTSGILRQRVVLLACAIAANDAAFLFLSGWVPRYHDRILILASVVLLLVLNHWRTRRHRASVHLRPQ